MPWMKSHVEEQRRRLIAQSLALANESTTQELCAAYEIRCKTGYKHQKKKSRRILRPASSDSRHGRLHATRFHPPSGRGFFYLAGCDEASVSVNRKRNKGYQAT